MDEEKKKKPITKQQIKALNLYCDHVAETLNEHGLYINVVLAKLSVDGLWSKLRVKELLWRKIQEDLLGKISTLQLNSDEVTLVYDALNKALGETFGEHIPFPSEEEILNRLRDEEFKRTGRY